MTCTPEKAGKKNQECHNLAEYLKRLGMRIYGVFHCHSIDTHC